MGFFRLMLLALLVPACVDEAEPIDDVVDATPGALPFLAVCAANADCATGLCFNFNAKGQHCTHACQAASDCASPSPGCSGMGVCKTP